MILRLLFLSSLIAVARAASAVPTCSSLNDCSDPTDVCNSGCKSCDNNGRCSSQHSVRKKCISISYGYGMGSTAIKYCSECTQSEGSLSCSEGKTCVTNENTYLCATVCSSPTASCGANAQCIWISSGDGGGGQFYCLSCETKADCKRWSGSSSSMCSGGVCSPTFLSCGYDIHCPNVNRAECSNNVCSPCTSDSACSHFSSTPVCKNPGASGVCVACVSHSDCTTASAAQCMPDNTCGPCTDSSRCTHFPSTPHCNTTSGKCVACSQSCSPKPSIQVLKFELQYSPQLYLLSFDAPMDLENSLAEIKLYQFSNSANLLSTDILEVSFILTKLNSSSYQLNFLSYTESSEDRSLLLSFDLFNLNSSYSYMISPSNSTTSVFADSQMAQAATTVGTTSQVIAIGTAASASLAYLQAKGASTQLMRILQVMARINFMKLININYLTPLAAFYNYTDLGQFGLPNVFNKIPGFNNSQTSTESTYKTDSQGHVIFNDYFRYSFSQVFLDNYGGIVFSICTNLILYLLVKVICKCFKNENSRIKKILIAAGKSFEKSIFLTLFVSRYSYLCSALILNYAFIPSNGAYQQISSGFAIIFTIIIVFVWILAICVSFYNGKNKAKLRSIRPLLRLLVLLFQEYRSKIYLGRVMAFWALFFNFIIMLVLKLLRKWVIVQLSVLIVLNVITILIALPKHVFKTAANKIIVIGTELGFIIINLLFLVMYSLENSNSYRVRLGLSWTAVVVNVAIILFQIVVKIVEFFRLRREKKREEQKHKQGSKMRAKEKSQVQPRRHRGFSISIAANSKGSWNRS